jgi:Uma2 family endonuclease
MSAAEQPHTLPRMTYEQFLEWAEEDTLAEWVNGEVVMTSPASDRHQDLVYFLVPLLQKYGRFRHLGKVQGAPFQMKITPSGREPDALYIASDHVSWLKSAYLDGPADLVVEVISPDSVKRDRVEKFFEYQAAGVQGYWLVDPGAQVAEFYQLGQLGDRTIYQRIAEDEQGIYRSAAISGFWLRVDWLWQDPLPDVEDVLFEVIGQAYLDQLTDRARQHGLAPKSEQS